MRAPFNDAMNVYMNDGAGGVGALRFTAPCRFVLTDHILQTRPVELSPTGYVTWSGLALSAGSADYSILGGGGHLQTADLVEIQSNAGFFFLVIRSEIIVPDEGTPYRRAWIA